MSSAEVVNTTPYPGAPSVSTTGAQGQSGSVDNLEALLGVGAFTIGGGGGSYGQDLSKDFVTGAITGPLGNLFTGTDLITTIVEFLPNLEKFITTLPLEALQIFELFLPPGIVTAITDVETAASDIVNAMGLGNVGVALGEFTGWLTATFGPLETLVQDVINAVGNAFGISGSSLNVTDITTGITNFFAAFGGATTITDVETFLSTLLSPSVFQGLLDAIANALGVSGTGHTVSNIGTYLGSIPQGNISGLTSALGTAATDLQAVIDGVFQAINGGTSTGNAASTVITSLESIPFDNVLGLLGPSNVGDALQASVDALWQGFTGLTGTGNSLGLLSNATAQTASTAADAQTLGQSNSTTLATRAVTKPTYLSLDPSGDSTFPWSSLSGATLPTINVTATNSVIGMIGIPDGGVKQAIYWDGSSTGSITGMFINIYKMNTSTGALAQVYASPDIHGSVSSSPSLNYYNLPTLADYLDTSQGDWYAAEMAITGTGTYSIAGLQHQGSANPLVFPQQLGATRGPAAPVFDAIGAGFQSTGNVSSGTVESYAHVLGSNANFIMVSMTLFNNAGTIAPTCTVGGVAATNWFANDWHSAGSNDETWIWYLQNPGTGSKTVAVTLTGSSTWQVSIQSVSYSGVSAVGPTTSNASTGTSTAPSLTYTGGAANETILGILGAGVGTFSSFNQTQRTTQTGVSGQKMAQLLGEVAGASSVTLSATLSSSGPWTVIAMPLIGTVPAAPSSISSPTYSPNVPFIGLAGSASVGRYAPETTEFSTAGTFTYTVPSWMVSGNSFDIVPLGAGGGGEGATFTSNGLGGHAGVFNPITLVYGVDIPLTTTSFSVVVGAGGALSVPNAGAASAGSSSTVTITGYGTITATGGAGGTGTTSSYPTGAGAGTETFNAIPYYGGAPDNNAAVANGPRLAGNAPGGGGAGGTEAYGSILSSGSDGAAGAVWIRAYQ